MYPSSTREWTRSRFSDGGSPVAEIAAVVNPRSAAYRPERWLYPRRDVSPACKLTYAALADHYDRDAGFALVNHRTIAGQLGITLRYVKELAGRLRRLGLIRTEIRRVEVVENMGVPVPQEWSRTVYLFPEHAWMKVGRG
jgi:hypothetical protein